MNTSKTYLTFLLCCGLFSLTSCIDDKYDLSEDIDTTTAIKLNGLVVPVNLETIYLDNVLKIDDEDPDNPVKIFTNNGKEFYAIEKTGDFIANEMFVDEINAKDYATINNIPLNMFGNKIQGATADFSYLITNVDEALISLNKIGMNENYPMEITLNITGNNNTRLDNVIIKIPNGFTAYYNNIEINNGEVNLGTLRVGDNSTPILVYAIDFGTGNYPVNGVLDINGKISIESADIIGDASNLQGHFSMSPFYANTVSGSINYRIDAPEIEPISLEGLPDFLKDGESNLIIQNPQLYLNFDNPVGADFNTGLTIQPIGNDGRNIYLDLYPFPGSIIIASDINNIDIDVPGSILMNAPELSYVLSGNGLPESIGFGLENTYLRGDVLNLQLGTYMSVGGIYKFFSPLAFSQNSKIIFQKSESDFFGDDMEDVEVSLLQLSAYPETNLPFSVNLTIYPLDKEGNHIVTNGKEVFATGVVDSNADGSKELNLTLSDFNGLDGVEYIVTVDDLNGETLMPSQYIKLNKIRAKVTGEYVTKL